MRFRLPAVIATAGVSLVAVPLRPAGAITVAEAVGRYAPVVYVHRQEKLLPATAANFVRGSELRWHHDSTCADHTVASVDGSPSRPPNEAALARGDYRHQTAHPRWSFRSSCDHEDAEYRSDQSVRPMGGGDSGGEGMFLDLDNGLRGGEGLKAPVYWAVHGKHIVYWFHYADNRPNVRRGPDLGHEGDWENITVELGPRNQAVRIYFAQHGGGCFVAADGKRPKVYSARGSHASYPRPGTHEYKVVDGPKGADAFIDDEADGDGRIWNTAAHLRKLSGEAWYGYGGGWGEVDPNKDLTGPSGPHPVHKQGLPKPGSGDCP